MAQNGGRKEFRERYTLLSPLQESVAPKPDLTHRRTFAKHVWSFGCLATAFASHHLTFSLSSESYMAQSQDYALPVLNPVTDYEKIKRVGEGTYGVVCMFHAFLRAYPVVRPA